MSEKRYIVELTPEERTHLISLINTGKASARTLLTRPHDAARPLVCLDETSKQLSDVHFPNADWQFTNEQARTRLKNLYPLV